MKKRKEGRKKKKEWKINIYEIVKKKFKMKTDIKKFKMRMKIVNTIFQRKGK